MKGVAAMKKMLGALITLLVFFLASCSVFERYSAPEEFSPVSEEPIDERATVEVQKNDQATEIVTLPLNDEIGKNRKLIKNANLVYETTSFEESLTFIQSEIEAQGGFIEHSNQSQSASSYGYDGTYITITARIPVGNLLRFVDVLNANADLTIRTQELGSTDVSKQYQDNEARIAILAAEEKALREMLEQQGSLKDILAVRERLNDVITEREQLASTNRNFDELADMSEVIISLQQTNRVNPLNTGGFVDRVWYALQDSFLVSVVFLQKAVIYIIYVLPYIFMGAVIYLIYKLLKKQLSKSTFAKKYSQKKQTHAKDLDSKSLFNHTAKTPDTKSPDINAVAKHPDDI